MVRKMLQARDSLIIKNQVHDFNPNTYATRKRYKIFLLGNLKFTVVNIVM